METLEGKYIETAGRVKRLKGSTSARKERQKRGHQFRNLWLRVFQNGKIAGLEIRMIEA